MPPVRTCSECGKPLSGKSVLAKTCGNACRLRRSRRVRRVNRQVEEFEQNNNAGAAEVAAIVRREAPDVVTRVMHDQLAPIVREALTEDVLRAVDRMVGLTPTAVAALESDLHSEDSTVRQRAYNLVIKYTVGHPALVKPADTEGGSQIVVNFSLPRPEDVPENGDVPQDAEHEELRNCDMCNTEKGLSQFVAGSTRCQDCFEEWRAKVLEEFA